MAFLAPVFEFSQFGNTLNEKCDFFAKLLFEAFGSNTGVLYHIMQKSRGNGCRIKAHISERAGRFQRMHNVGFAGGAFLAFMSGLSNAKRTLNKRFILLQ